jgi:pyruvate oxidase
MANLCDMLVDYLAEAGVRQIFGVPGDAINGLTESLRKQKAIQFIHVNHEESGAFAACAQAKLTGGLAVCAGTAGPGAIHLLNGLYDAKCDHAPVLAITGQVESRFLGSDYQQEVDLKRLFGDVAIYNQIVTQPEQASYMVARAIRTALEARGVTHLSLPVDIAAKSIPSGKRWTIIPPLTPATLADGEAIAQAASLLNQHKRVAILAGIGCRGAQHLVYALAEKLGAPIIHALRGKELFPESHPLSVGGLGNLGVRPAHEAVQDCDLLLMIGTDFPYFDFYPPHAQAIQIDIDPRQIGKRQPVGLGIVGEAGAVLEALLPRVREKKQRQFLSHAQGGMGHW